MAWGITAQVAHTDGEWSGSVQVPYFTLPGDTAATAEGAEKIAAALVSEEYGHLVNAVVHVTAAEVDRDAWPAPGRHRKETS